MTGFKPRTSGIGSDHSTNWATTTAQLSKCLFRINRLSIDRLDNRPFWYRKVKHCHFLKQVFARLHKTWFLCHYLKQITLLCPIYWVAMLLLYREIIIITKAIWLLLQKAFTLLLSCAMSIICFQSNHKGYTYDRTDRKTAQSRKLRT